MKDALKKARDQLVVAAQVIAKELPGHLKQNGTSIDASFPSGVIRTLHSLYSRWPYLSKARKRTVACAIQLCDINKFHLNTWRIGLTAGTMHEWHCTVPVIAVIETLLYEFGRQYKLIAEGAKFKTVINTLHSAGILKHPFQQELHRLREYRNELHLSSKGKVEMYDGKYKRYNDAVRALGKVEQALKRAAAKI